MNPLDVEELQAFLKIIKKDMPLHTEDTAKIKRSYSQYMPKNIMDYSQKIDNEFLNDNLHTIEEMEYRKKGMTNNFKNYQNKYYDESGILNHDLYFEHENKMYSKISGSGVIINPYAFGVPCNGVTLIPVTADSSGTISTGFIYSLRAVGTIGKCYDQIGINVQTSVGNIRLASYNETGSVPDVLQAELASTASAGTGVNYYSVALWSLTTVNNWISVQTSSSSFVAYLELAASIKYKAQAYGTFPNPITGTLDTTQAYDLRLKHS